MGSQWAGMARELMPMKTFEDSILKCAAALKSVNVDLMEIINNCTEDYFDNIINSFITITFIQIALVDLLTLLEIFPRENIDGSNIYCGDRFVRQSHSHFLH